MMTLFNPIDDFTTLPVDAIALEPELINQAVKLCEQLPSQQQWQGYLNALALFGFEQWLVQREPSLSLNKNQCNVFQSQYANITEAVCRLQVGEFKLCLLAKGVLEDEIVVIPSAILDSPDYNAHFYILVTVDEEQDHVFPEGIIRYDQLIALNLSPQSDGTYEVPFREFNPDINQLLLYLRCLEPNSIPLPNILSRFTQSVINVGSWLQGELDELSERLSWILLPQPAFATVSFRAFPTLNIILEELQECGVNIPDATSGAYKDFSLGELSFRLYALTWVLEDTDEWSLLLIIGMQSDDLLPEGFKLQISDTNRILLERVVEANTDETYLYARIVGSQNEQFIVEISLMDGESLTLSPFTFISG